MISAMVDLLGTYYQNGNLAQMEVMARSLLAAIPDDLVGLQFLGLALYERGRKAEAMGLFRRAAEIAPVLLESRPSPSREPAALATYREATRPGSPLESAWKRLRAILAGKRIH